MPYDQKEWQIPETPKHLLWLSKSTVSMDGTTGNGWSSKETKTDKSYEE